MSLTEKSHRPGWGTGAATDGASTTSGSNRSLSAVPLIVVMCLQIVAVTGFVIADAIGAIR